MSEQTIPLTEVLSAPRRSSRTLAAREAAATKLVASADLATHSHQRLLRPSGRQSGSAKHAHEVSSQCHHPAVLVRSTIPACSGASSTLTLASTPVRLPADTSKPCIPSEAMILLTGRASANFSTSTDAIAAAENRPFGITFAGLGATITAGELSQSQLRR